MALWRAQGSSTDLRLGAALEAVDAEAGSARVLKRNRFVPELGLSAAVLRRLLPTAEPADAFSLLHRFWSHLSDEERGEFKGVLWLSAPAFRFLVPLDEMADFISDRALAESWRRELLVLGHEWVMPARLLRRAGGEEALEAWVRGAEEIFGEGRGSSQGFTRGRPDNP